MFGYTGQLSSASLQHTAATPLHASTQLQEGLHVRSATGLSKRTAACIVSNAIDSEGCCHSTCRPLIPLSCRLDYCCGNKHSAATATCYVSSPVPHSLWHHRTQLTHLNTRVLICGSLTDTEAFLQCLKLASTLLQTLSYMTDCLALDCL